MLELEESIGIKLHAHVVDRRRADWRVLPQAERATILKGKRDK
jgi:hypothetical protein